MKPNEIIEESFIDSFKRTLAVLAVASSFGNMVPTVAEHNHNSTYSSSINIDKELTYAGREAIKNLPDVIKNKLGDINTIVFVSGIPEGGSKRAVCQVAKGTRIVYVNPKFRQIFLNGASDQLTAHELTHIAQSNMSRQMQDRFPETDSDEDDLTILEQREKRDAIKHKRWERDREKGKYTLKETAAWTAASLGVVARNAARDVFENLLAPKAGIGLEAFIPDETQRNLFIEKLRRDGVELFVEFQNQYRLRAAETIKKEAPESDEK